MVIVSPILERESDDHGETIWNTAGLELIEFFLFNFI
jgi:hypothetical protein